jgi:hypothetical protein
VTVGVREGEAPLERSLGCVFDVDDARHCLLLEPFLGIPLGDPGLRRERARCHGARPGQGLVEPEPHPQLNVGELHGREAGHEQVAGEFFDLRFVVCGQLDRGHTPSACSVARTGAT